jgi:radical SAM superfamily enzyme YgiQ (UPF0313 family)
MYVMMGIPGESLSDYFETVECVRQCKPDFVQLGIFEPYPGTELYNKGLNEGLFDETILDDFPVNRYHATLNLPGFSKIRIQMEYFLFHYRTSTGKIPIAKIILWLFDHKIGKFNLLDFLLKIHSRKYIQLNLASFE